MKFAISILLFVFISFLSVPTIVMLIEKKVNTSAFYSFSEEEIHKDFQAQIKEIYSFKIILFQPFYKIKIFNSNQFDFDLISKEILIPPPKAV